jgi:hypothetical protein
VRLPKRISPDGPLTRHTTWLCAPAISTDKRTPLDGVQRNPALEPPLFHPFDTISVQYDLTRPGASALRWSVIWAIGASVMAICLSGLRHAPSCRK